MKQEVGCIPYLELQERQRREKVLVDALRDARGCIVQEYYGNTTPVFNCLEVLNKIDDALLSCKGGQDEKS